MDEASKLPLAGRRVLITRTREQASELAARLEELGAETISIPTIEVVDPVSWEGLDAALGALAGFDWVVFTSANAVSRFCVRASLLGVSPRAAKIAAIGPATAKAVRACGLEVALMPEQYVAESFLEALLPVAGTRVLLVRAAEARDVLPEGLAAAGVEVTVVEAYRNVVPVSAASLLAEVLGCGVDAITFTSSSTVTNFFGLLQLAGLGLPDGVALVSIGPVTSRTLRGLGFEPSAEAGVATIDGLVVALVGWFSRSSVSREVDPLRG